MVGSSDGIHNLHEWKALLNDALQWTQQNVADRGRAKVITIFGHASPSTDHQIYFDGLSNLAKETEILFLYMHGDTHRWKKDRPFDANNIIRVVVDQGGVADPVKVVIDLNRKRPDISFERRSLSNQYLRRGEK